MARLKSNLYFPPLNLDFGAPIPSVIAYFEAAEPITMLPACSTCGYLYYKPSELPAMYHGNVGNVSSTSYSPSSHALNSAQIKSPLELLADVQSAEQNNKTNSGKLILSSLSSSPTSANVNTNEKSGKIREITLAKNKDNLLLTKTADVKDKSVANEMMIP